jgi:hypothetical protein
MNKSPMPLVFIIKRVYIHSKKVLAYYHRKDNSPEEILLLSLLNILTAIVARRPSEVMRNTDLQEVPE